MTIWVEVKSVIVETGGQVRECTWKSESRADLATAARLVAELFGGDDIAIEEADGVLKIDLKRISPGQSSAALELVRSALARSLCCA